MAREVIYETYFTKAPNQDRLRKSAEGRLKYLLKQGWQETAREKVAADSYRVRFEREIAKRPLPPLRTKPEPPPRRREGGFGRGGGGRGGPGGRGGGRGGPPTTGGGPGNTGTRGGGPPRTG